MKDVEVASVVGARPNFIKLAPIHNCLKESQSQDNSYCTTL